MLGTGIMGAGMAGSLLRAGCDVRAWNRTASKAEPLTAEGATVPESAAAAVEGADFVVTMLFDADAVLAVIGEAAHAFGPETIWIQSSTIGLEGTKRCADLAAERGLTMLDAPVLGTKAPAEQGKLVALVSGDSAAIDRAQPVFDAIAARAVRAGDELGRASALKLACNAWVASINAATAQSIALARGLGLEPQLFLDAIGGGPTDSAYAQAKGQQMISGQFPTSFAVDGVIKDLELISAAAVLAGVSDQVLSALLGRYRQASDAGHGGSDMSAVYAGFAAPES
ncbi:NAD(P)-dependent oxidoreductase [Jatrophihabitans telluris]